MTSAGLMSRTERLTAAHDVDQSHSVLALWQARREELERAVAICPSGQIQPHPIGLSWRDGRVEVDLVLRSLGYTIAPRRRVDGHGRAGKVEGEARVLVHRERGRAVPAYIVCLNLAECLQRGRVGFDGRLAERRTGMRGGHWHTGGNSPLGADLRANDNPIQIERKLRVGVIARRVAGDKVDAVETLSEVCVREEDVRSVIQSVLRVAGPLAVDVHRYGQVTLAIDGHGGACGESRRSCESDGSRADSLLTYLRS